MAVLEESERDMNGRMEKITKVSKEYGTRINMAKNKSVIIRLTRKKLRAGGAEVKQVSSFRYLRICIRIRGESRT